jgi:CheY-like chemotaxis protein
MTMAFMLGVGKIIVDGFYDGDVGELRKRSRKDVSLRQLAQHPDLCLRPDQLYRLIASYELLLRVGLSTKGRLSTSHLHCCLPLSAADQERLLRWSVRRLRDEIREQALVPAQRRGGRASQPPLRKAIRAANAVLRSPLDEAGIGTASPEILRLVDQLRDVCGQIEGRFAASGPPWPNLNEQGGDAAIARESHDAERRILIVEDNERLAAALARIASRHGAVTIVHTASDARSALLEASGAYAALVIDVGLPDGSGLDLIRWFREQFERRSARLLAISGHVSRELINATCDVGVPLLAKPFGQALFTRFLEASPGSTETAA